MKPEDLKLIAEAIGIPKPFISVNCVYYHYDPFDNDKGYGMFSPITNTDQAKKIKQWLIKEGLWYKIIVDPKGCNCEIGMSGTEVEKNVNGYGHSEEIALCTAVIELIKQ